MKYLAIFKPREHTMANLTAARLMGLHRKLARAKKQGIVESAYTIASGGHVLVINSRTNAGLGKILQAHPLYATNNVEVTPLIDTKVALNSYLKQKFVYGKRT